MTTSVIHILSTRPLSDTLIGEAGRHGIVIDAQAFITTTPVDDESLRQHVAVLAKQPLITVFTSMNAVETVGEWIGQAAARPGITAGWTIFCIGSATRRLAEKYFGPASIAGTAESAKALAEMIVRERPGQELYFFCGDQRRDELPEILKRAGSALHELVVYHTTPTPVRAARAYDGIVFFSPSAVESYFSVNTVSSGATLFAIGKTTAEAIGLHSSNPVVISGQPDKEVLIHEVIDHFQTKNSQHRTL